MSQTPHVLRQVACRCLSCTGTAVLTFNMLASKGCPTNVYAYFICMGAKTVATTELGAIYRTTGKKSDTSVFQH